MERIYYSRQNYNQLKKKQYEEYIENQNRYYLYIKKYYEEYVKNQKNYYLDKKKYDEEYAKRQNAYYIYIKRYYEEYVKNQKKYSLAQKKYYEEYITRQNRCYRYIKRYYEEYIKNQKKYNLDQKKYYEEYISKQNKYYIYIKRYYEEYVKNQNNYYLNQKKYYKTDNSQSEFSDSFKTSNIEDNNINDNSIKNSVYGSLEINNKENNLEYKKNNSIIYDNLENKNCTSIEDSYNEEYLEENNKEILEENNEEILEKNYEEYIKGNNEESLGENDKETLEENNEEYLRKNDEEILEENNEEETLGQSDEKFLEESDEESLEENNEEFLGEEYSTIEKDEISKETNIFDEGVYVKFPVILAETNITIPIEATITFDQAVIGIKEVKKNLFLSQSHLIPFSSSDLEPNSGILFIAGFIRKNIEYKTQTCNDEITTNVCGDIRHCTVEVPFNFTTRINFIREPIFIEKPTTREIEFFTDRLKVCDSCANIVIGHDPYEQSFVFTEIFNEKPFIELVKATFIEVDIKNNPILSQEISVEQMFTKITEKIIVDLTLKVLQKQQLKVLIE